MKSIRPRVAYQVSIKPLPKSSFCDGPDWPACPAHDPTWTCLWSIHSLSSRYESSPLRTSLADLIRVEMLTEDQAATLIDAVRDEQDILIAGGNRRFWACWLMPFQNTSAFCSSRTPPNCTSANPTSFRLNRRPIPIAAKLPSTNSSKRSFGTGPTVSSSARYADRRREPCWTR
jgi:hypothetical protein